MVACLTAALVITRLADFRTYQCAKGNVYLGHWLENEMHGIGYLKWAYGKEYNGENSEMTKESATATLSG